MQQANQVQGSAGVVPKPKVLICSVDGGWFGVRADWVEAVCPRSNVTLQNLRTADNKVVRYAICQGDPALIVELRALTGIEPSGGRARRKQFLLVRSTQCLLAVPVDTCIGVRAIDLDSRAPVATRIRRDGGLPLGHIVEVDGRMLVVLDPARLLDADGRAAWPQIARRAELLNRRVAKCDAARQEVQVKPSAEALRTYASLCSRTGRSATASAARAALAYLASPGGDAASSLGDLAIRTLVGYGADGRTGRFVAERSNGPEIAIELNEGRLADPRSACASMIQILNGSPTSVRLEDGAGSTARVGDDAASVLSVLIDAIEASAADSKRR